jgi:hypothetical protein
MEATVYKTINHIEWYKVSENRYEGFNKETESWDFIVHNEFDRSVWVYEGIKSQNPQHGKDKDALMIAASKK